MVSSIKTRRFRFLEAWDTLKQRNLEYAINLLIAGEWVANGIVKDGYSCLDAKVGSERCQETAALVLILRRELLRYLDDHGLTQEFKSLIADYRSQHVSDKRYNEIFTIDDVRIGSDERYEQIKDSVIDFMGSDWTTFLCYAHTIALFSVLSTTECGIPNRYRRSSDVLVETTPEQRDAGLGEYHDAEFPMRTEFTEVSFRLIDKLSNKILPEGTLEVPFGESPRWCGTAAEEAREIFHFSKAIKRPGCREEYPITIASFSASMQILLRLCWLYGIPVTVCMPRLRYDGPSPGCNGNHAASGLKNLDEAATYKLTSAPVITYVPTDKNGGSFRMVDLNEAGIEDEPCWKLLGYSMYHRSQSGQLLTSTDDAEYVQALKKVDLNHIVSIFGFFHEEYPARTENAPDIDALYQTVCGDGGNTEMDSSFEGYSYRCGMNPNDEANTTSLLSFRNATANLSEKHDLQDTFIAHQRGPNTSYQMQHKSIPFTFSHIDISTPRAEEQKWAAMLHKHDSTSQPMFANLFTVGNTVYSMRDKAEADRLMRMNNNNQKIRDLMAIHPGHVVFLRDDHKEKWERWQTEKRKKNKVKL
ncbi:uncharacterized protein B0J16DRAFT_309332 [Fusarium flagelliforme]|uniref:Uncharacterized protein n=1 Tax=Fusarium flagelliforme TaxID=2675880 RepID=A0A395M9D7_9HYPO|nr:uncharacterized protein B0J16DRAFT_309332 [Fusarium flagelliforme]KAH7179962.1 hypothetical protein B0J16DRAFT_309332 [Fusarium flagelliforme]RFN44504.1 hypothetical protein FIE12Z_11218 [Fusarium flagelliforme]